MGAKTLEELEAWYLSREFKRAIYALVRQHPEVRRDVRYYNQLASAAADAEADVAEGWHRRAAAQFRVFLQYARASNGEAGVRLADGVDRGYFTAAEISAAQQLGERAKRAITALHASQARFVGTPWPGEPPPRRHRRRREPD